MASDPLVNAQIEGQARIRNIVAKALTAIWRDLPNYDRPAIDQWLSEALPVVQAGQVQSVNLTNAYLAAALQSQPLPLDATQLTGASVRNGTPPEVVYERPFVTLWSGLKAGLDYQDAVHKGLARAVDMSSYDVQGSFRATADAVQQAVSNLYGFERVADAGACSFCLEVNGAYCLRASASPLHPHCGCGLRCLTAPHKNAVHLPSGLQIRENQWGPLNDNVAIHDHGEMGPVLTGADEHFTSQSQLN